MSVAAALVWIGRFVFLGLLYFFIYRICRTLLLTHQSGTATNVQSAARILVEDVDTSCELWLEERDGGERRLAQGSRVDLGTIFRVGRGKGNTLRLTDPYVSMQHLVIQKGDDRYIIGDLGTRNGTSVDGKPLRGQAPLEPNCVIQVGSTRLRFEVT